MTRTQVGALVLAAGSGRRIGIPKLRLVTEGRSFLAQVVQTLADAGVTNVCCVVAQEDASWATAEAPGAIIAVNSDPGRGMGSSVSTGLRCLGDLAGFVVWPVDHPYVAASTAEMLIQDFQKFPECAIKPLCNARAGHPIILPPSVAALFMSGSQELTLRELLRQPGVKVRGVAVNDQGVLANVNTPADIR